MRSADLREHIDEPVELNKGETVVRISSHEKSEGVRKAIFGTIGVLDLEPHKEGMILNEEELNIVKTEVLPRFPDLDMHDFYNPKVPEGIQLISIKADTNNDALAEIRKPSRTEKAVRAYSILHSNNPNSLDDRDWAGFNRMKSRAVQLAKKVGVKFVNKGQFHFFHEGHGIEWRNGGEGLIAEKDLREWKSRVDSGEFEEDDEAMTG